MRKRWNMKERLTAVALSAFLVLSSFSGSNLLVFGTEKDNVSDTADVVSSNEVTEDEIISENETGNIDAAENNEDVEDAAGSVTGNEADKPVVEGSSEDAAGNETKTVGDYELEYNGTVLVKATKTGGTGASLDLSGENFTEIAKNAFKDNADLKALSFPTTLNAIGADAFANSGLTGAINIPDNVASIASGAFQGCAGITSVRLPDKLDTLSKEGVLFSVYPTGAFKDCTSLTTVTNVGNITNVYEGGYAFPERRAFGGCSSLTTIEFRNDITKIPAGLFAYSSGLKKVTIPSTVTEISNYAFEGDVNLKEVAFAEGSKLVTIGNAAFDGDTAMDSFGWSRLSLLQSIGDSAFRGCTKLEGALNIPDNVNLIASGAFEGCTGITSLRLPDKLDTLSKEGVLFSVYPTGAFKDCTSLTTVTNVGNITNVYEGGYAFPERRAFGGCSSLTTIEFRNDITKIPAGLFAYSSGLKKVTIPSTVTEISNYAFKGDVNLKEVAFAEGSKLVTIGTEAFNLDTALDTIGWSNEVTQRLQTIGEYAFAGCTALEGTLTIPDNVNTICSGAFEGCTKITKVKFPDKLNSLGASDFGHGAFKDCSALTEVNNVGNISKVHTYGHGYPERKTFNGCNSLVTVGFRDDVTVIPAGLFAYCNGLKTINIPATVQIISESAFRGCQNLKTVNMAAGSRLYKIESNAFLQCVTLDSFGWDKLGKLSTIGDYAFKGCTSLDGTLTLPSTVATIGDGTFEGCTKIKELVLSDSLTSLGNAFTGCTGLTKVTNIGEIGKVGSKPFSGCNSLETVEFRRGIKIIPANLFSNNAGLYSVTIPEGVTEIGSCVFEKCTGLHDISLPTTLETVRKSAFNGDTNLDTVNYAGSSDSWDYITIEANNDPLTNAKRTYQNKPCIRTITYEYNGGTDKGGKSSSEAVFEVGSKLTTFPDITNEGFTLEGWYEDSAFKTKWDPQKLISKTITLYAKWKADAGVKTYTVRFDKNGGTGEMSDLIVARDTTKKLPKNTFTRTNYDFKGWATTADGSAIYEDEANIKNLADAGKTITLYAVWREKGAEPDPQTGSFTVKYNSNGGTGTMADQVISLGKKTALTANAFTRSGYEFSGWSDSKSGSAKYADTAEVQDLAKDGESITLYAVWVLPSKGETYYSINVYAGAEAFKDGKTVYSAKKGQTITIKYTSTSKQKEFKEWVLTGATPKDKTAKETTFVMGTTDVLVNYSYEINEESKKETPPPADSTPVKKLAFAKKSLKLKPDDEISNPATPTYGNSTERPEVKYVTSNSNIICVDTTGTFIATGRGSATVTAYCGNKKATCKVTVMNFTQDIAIMTANGEDITGDTYEINAGSQEMFHVAFDPCDTGDPIAVTWKSSNTKAVGVAKGLISAKDVKQDVASTITATVKYTNPSTGKTSNMSKTVTVRVKPITVPANSTGDKSYTLSLKKSNVKLQRNISGKDSYALGITLVPKKGKSVADKLVSITSSNPSIVDVSSEEGIPVINSKGKGEVNVNLISEGNGTAYIIVKSYEAGSEDDSKVNIKRCKVTVTSPATGIEITEDTSSLLERTGDQKRIEMRLGTYDTLTAEVTPEDSTDAGKITWSASGGVTVKNGMIYAKSLTKSEKTAKVTARCGKKKATVYVTVVK